MAKYDFEEQLSDTDTDTDNDNGNDDDTLLKDLTGITTACLPSISGEFSDDDDDDLALVNNLKQQYCTSAGGDLSNPISREPISSLPPLSFDDDDDDFETLRAIKSYCRSQYDPNRDKDEGVTETKSELGKSQPDDANGGSSGNDLLDVCKENVEQEPCDTVGNPETCNDMLSLPKAALTLIEAIKKNRSCRNFIEKKILHIESRKEEVEVVLKRVRTLRDYQLHCKKIVGRALSQKHDARIQLISVAKPRANGTQKPPSSISYGPVENSQVACYRATLEKFPLSFHREKWSKEEKENLEKGIIQQLQETVANSAFQEPEFCNRVDATLSSIEKISITPEIIREFSGKVNWEQLASKYCLRRSGAECEARWLNYENRLINRDNWTHDEEKYLLYLVDHHGFNNWSYIAEKLKTNRTPFQCLARYQRSLNKCILKSDWSEEEDALLRSAVETFGESNWQAVASTLEGRTGPQCSNRWNKTLHPNRLKVGKWSDDEDKRLKVAVTLFGQKSWHRIAQFVPGRTQAQCRERWVNVLDPCLNRGAWTEEEDLKLKEAIAEYGYCWSKVATCVPMRTDNQCRRRWKRLFPHEVPLLQAARKIQKVALISNFVDRESERPALGPNDFIPLPIEDSAKDRECDNVPQKRKKSRNKLEEAGRKKSRKRARSPEVRMTRDRVDEGNNDCEKLVKIKRVKHNFSSKKKRCSGNANTATELNKKSESKEAEEIGETNTWGVSVNLKSRRPRRARSKVIPRMSDFYVLQDTDLDDTNIDTTVSSCSWENTDPEELLGQSTSSASQLMDSQHKEVDASNIENERKHCSLQVRQEDSFTLPVHGVKSSVTSEVRTSSSIDSSKTLSMVSDGSSKRKNAKHMLKKGKLYPGRTKKWENLPLSVLFPEAVMRFQRSKSNEDSKDIGESEDDLLLKQLRKKHCSQPEVCLDTGFIVEKGDSNPDEEGTQLDPTCSPLAGIDASLVTFAQEMFDGIDVHLNQFTLDDFQLLDTDKSGYVGDDSKSKNFGDEQDLNNFFENLGLPFTNSSCQTTDIQKSPPLVYVRRKKKDERALQ